MPNPEPEKKSSRPALHDICSQAIACLQEGLQDSSAELKRKVDKAENLVVRLRDGLIEELRGDSALSMRGQNAYSTPSASRCRTLDQVNTALSLVVGVAYPSSRIRQKYVEEAIGLLQDAATALPA